VIAQPAADHPPARASRPAPRWLWIVTLLVVATLTLLRLSVFSSLDLRTDEAYYWTWSQQPALSYLDQPPMVAWFVRLGTLLFGDTPLGARFAFLLALPLTELILADIARRRSGSMAAALLVVLAMEATVNFGVTSAIIEPGIPLLLFAGLMFWSLCRLEETGDLRWWLGVGAGAGLALLAKFMLIFFAPALLVYFIATVRQRRWLNGPWLWGGIGLALLLFTPVLWWNAQHDWAAFRFQGGRATSVAPANFAYFGNYLATNLAFVGPLLAPVIVWGAVAAGLRWRRDPVLLALAVAFLAPFLYLAERALHLPVNPSWAIVMWPFGITALAIVACRDPAVGKGLRRFTAAGILTGLPLVVALLLHAILPGGVWLGARDPIGADAGYAPMAAKVLAAAKAQGATWIATSDYRTYAALRWHLGRDLPVVEVVERSRFLDFAAPDLTLINGRPGLYVFPAGSGNPLVAEATAGHNLPLGSIDRIWRGTVMGSFSVERIDGWSPPLNPPPASPFYAWPDLT
jgi:4-amino-4-deoxy-L-arabinose transferase-like glycosyltransferase